MGVDRWMTNSEDFLKMLRKMKSCGGEWARRRIGGEFGEKTCDELFDAILKQMRRDGRFNAGEIGAVVPMDKGGVNWGGVGEEECLLDDLSGEALRPELVR